MERVIKLLVENEADAFKVVSKLQELNNQNEIVLGEVFVFVKDLEGTVTLKDGTGSVSNTALFGAFAAGVTGLITGPFGFLSDDRFMGVAASFVNFVNLKKEKNQQKYLQKVAEDVPNGKVLIISHISESWTASVDLKLGGIAQITRIDIEAEIDKAIEKAISELNERMAAVEKAIEHSDEQEKVKLQAKLNLLHEEKSAQKDELRLKMELQRDLAMFTETLLLKLAKGKGVYRDWSKKVREQYLLMKTTLQ